LEEVQAAAVEEAAAEHSDHRRCIVFRVFAASEAVHCVPGVCSLRSSALRNRTSYSRMDNFSGSALLLVYVQSKQLTGLLIEYMTIN